MIAHKNAQLLFLWLTLNVCSGRYSVTSAVTFQKIKEYSQNVFKSQILVAVCGQNVSERIFRLPQDIKLSHHN